VVERKTVHALEDWQALAAMPSPLSIERFARWHPGCAEAFRLLYEDENQAIADIPRVLSRGFGCKITAGTSSGRSDGVAARISALGRGLGFKRSKKRFNREFINRVVEKADDLRKEFGKQLYSAKSLSKALGMPYWSVRRCLGQLGGLRGRFRQEQVQNLLQAVCAYIVGHKQHVGLRQGETKAVVAAGRRGRNQK
jgi:hypothetical protein